jgi:hypothetical protein
LFPAWLDSNFFFGWRAAFFEAEIARLPRAGFVFSFRFTRSESRF